MRKLLNHCKRKKRSRESYKNSRLRFFHDNGLVREACILLLTMIVFCTQVMAYWIIDLFHQCQTGDIRVYRQ